MYSHHTPIADESTMILFRTHRDTPRNRERIEFLRRTSGLRVVVAIDESSDRSAFIDLPRVPVGPAVYERLGLGSDPRLGWRCGDYCYYAARIAFPEISHFWLVEYDVLFSFENSSEFFSRYSGMPEVDFLAARVGEAEKDWAWTEMMNAVDGPIYRSFFPVTRMSAPAIDHCYKKRRVDFDSNSIPFERWPNDEVFVPTNLVRRGFTVKDLNCVPRTYRPTLYNFVVTRNYEREVRNIRKSLMHPVLDDEELALKPHSTPPKTPLHAVKRYLVVLMGG